MSKENGIRARISFKKRCWKGSQSEMEILSLIDSMETSFWNHIRPIRRTLLELTITMM